MPREHKLDDLSFKTAPLGSVASKHKQRLRQRLNDHGKRGEKIAQSLAVLEAPNIYNDWSIGFDSPISPPFVTVLDRPGLAAYLTGEHVHTVRIEPK